MVEQFIFIWGIITVGVFAFWSFMDWVIPVEEGDLVTADFPFHIQLLGNAAMALALTFGGYLIAIAI